MQAARYLRRHVAELLMVVMIILLLLMIIVSVLYVVRQLKIVEKPVSSAESVDILPTLNIDAFEKLW